VIAPRIAVVGAGHMGRFHAQKLRALEESGEARLAGVFDLDQARAAELARACGAPRLASLEAVIEASDAACLAVPTVAHGEVGLLLLRGGIDLLIEKPIAATRDEARALIDTAAERGRVLQIGHVERFSRALRSILPLIRRPRFIEAHRMGPYPGRATDVGVVLDLMIHDLDIVQLLAGAEVEHAEAVGVPVLSSTEDIANARVRFRNGCVLNLTASRVSVEPMRKIRLFQSDAYLSIDLLRNQITVMRREGEAGAGEAPKIHAERIELDEGDALLEQDRAFARCVRERARPEVGGEEAYRALDLALRIQASLPSLEELA
jgi:predicted dehydrogenase